MKRYLKFVAPIISLLALFMLFCFKTVPSGKLWKGYNVLYVPVETDDSTVINVFKDLEINDHFELSGQYIPLLFSAYSPEISMLRLHSTDSEYQYLSKRNAYFFDKSNKYRLYYIPTAYKNQLGDCINILSKQGIKAGMDGSASYPFLIPVITFILFVILLLSSKYKIVFGAGSALLLVYVYCNPFYSSAVAVCLFMLCIFFLSNVWNRKGFVNYLLGNYAIPAMLFFSLVGAFAGSLKAGFMFILTAAGCFALIYSVCELLNFLLSKRSFVPVFIRPAKRVSVYGGKLTQTLVGTICSVLFLLIVSLITSNTSINAKFAKLVLPAANGGSSELVTLDDYYDFAWNVSSYPYKSLNKNDNEGFYEYPHYVEKDGVIVETKKVRAFNDSFKTETYDAIDNLQFNSVEKLIKSQGSEVKPGYASSGSYRTSIFAIITMLLSLTILLFIYISSIIRKGVRK